MEFHVGQEVVCVDDTEFRHKAPNRPVKNCHYTIRETWLCPIDGEAGVYLQEIVNKPCRVVCDGGKMAIREPGWLATRFRPINPELTAIFREMCVPKKGKARV